MVEERAMRVAAIDCGTNSIRLLIADIEGNSFREVTRLMEVVRLGQGVDKTGQFHPDAITRTLTAPPPRSTRKNRELAGPGSGMPPATRWPACAPRGMKRPSGWRRRSRW